MMMYDLVLPGYFDDYESEIEAKGVFADATIVANDANYRPTFYDPMRFRQDVEAEWEGGSSAAVFRNTIVLRTVNRATIEAAVGELATREFIDLVPESQPDTE
jgi:hypothetical protein